MTYRSFSSVLMLCALLVVYGESAAQNTASSDADLSGLTLSAGTLDPAFARDSLAYTATVADSIDSLTVTPTSNHNGATITVNGTSVSSGSASSAISLGVGENTITIVVAAEDGTTTKTYTVTVMRGVNIPDANLRAAIEGALNKSSGAIIIPSEMATLIRLDAQGLALGDLTGLEYATRLDSLHLHHNSRLSDISALSGLTSLTYLTLAHNGISDISALSGLTSLTYLTLAHNGISDISALSSLTSLRLLSLRFNGISDISALSGLTSLTYLSFSDNRVSDISALSGLTSLDTLYLYRNRVSDISALSSLTSLEFLDLHRNRISDISALSSLTSLEFLDLHRNNISDISALSGLTRLERLVLNDNLLNYPSFATHIPALQSRVDSIKYDARTLTSLVKISGDDQTSTAGSRLSDPFIVEVRDQNAVAFAGVPVAFSVTAGGGSLSTTTDTTDANGRASTRLTLGAAGADTVVAAIDVSNIDKSVTFTATATGATAEGATISSTVPAALTETNLNGAKVNITLTGATYNETLAANHFALHTAPQGTSISGTPVRTSATVAQLTLAYAGLGFDANQSLRVTVKAAAHSGSGDLTTESVTVTPVQGTGPVTVVTEPGQVTGVTVTPGVGYLDVSWSAVTGATGYKVQWKSGDALYASDRQQVIGNGGKTSATITGLTAGTEYTVRVIATLTNADDGQPSVGVTGTPIARTTSSDADLSGLTLSAGTLDPAFARDSLAYTATVANSIDSLTVTPTSNHNGATITVNGTSVSSGSASRAISLSVGENTITIVVAAEDGTTTKTYTVTVTRGVNIPDANTQNTASSDADLSGLTLSAGTLDPAFARDSLSYTATVANSIDSLTVTPTSNHNGATITVNGTSVSSGSASRAISLGVGENTITIVVAAEDSTTKTYTVTVTRGVNIPDANLRAVIEGALKKSSGAIIIPSEMATLIRLTASRKNIRDLTGLEHATSLTVLFLSSNGISDISALSGLTSLRMLHLYYNRISDISALSGLTSLERLHLAKNHNRISDISALSGLTSLRELYLYDNRISDISALSGLTSLTSLGLANNRISDISALSGLTSLTSLGLANNRISDISALSGLTSLTELILANNNISDISAMSGLTSLTSLFLYIHRNPLSYPSLTTHIPAFQSRIAYVRYDTRTLTSLVKISGDDQTGTAGSRLSDPFIVEVRDTNDVAFAGVPVAFSVTAGGGSLNTTTDTTDANGRASTRLTLGVAGADTIVAAIDVSNIDKSVTFTATATGGTTAEGATISSTVPSALTETNLNGAKVNITLTGTTYNETLATNHFALHTAPQGTSISGTPVRTSATVAQLTLAYAGLGFDANQSLRVTVKAAAHSGSGDLTTESVTVTPAQVTGPVTVVTEPGQVTGVTVTPGVGYLDVSWSAVTGATGYKVQWKSGEALYASDRQQVINNGGKTSATITSLTAGTEYTVRVIATLTNADDGQPSVGVTGTPIARTTSPPPSPPPPAPPPSPPDNTASDHLPSFGRSTVTAQRYRTGTAISITLPQATGGVGTLTYSLTPDLPSGLKFDETTRVLSGLPQEVMDETEYTLTATDEDGVAAPLKFMLSVAVDRRPSFSDSTRVAAQRYQQGTAIAPLTLPTATGGDEALTYALTPELPSGLTFDAKMRILSGTPQEALDATEYTLTATDGDGDVARLTFTLSVVVADLRPSFGDSTRVAAQRYQQGTPILSLTLPAARSGNGVLIYTLTPDLPSGLTFDAKTRELSGTPSEVMDETAYTLTVTDRDGDGATLTFTISVVADRLPSFGDSTRIAAQRYIIGDSVRVTLPEATGGDGTPGYILTPDLPSGLTFNAKTRVLSGTPSKVLTETEYTLSALDADGDTASLTFTLEVQQPTADIDGNGQVNFADFLSFAGKFGTRRGDAGYDARCDFDSDGEIGFSDFLILVNNFGTGG